MTADAVGGVYSYALALARGLAARGVRVALATMGPRPSPAQRAEARTIPGLQLVESDFRLEWMDDPWDDVRRAGDWLLALEERLRPDVVHLNGYVHAALPWRRRPVVVAHSCNVSWWWDVKGEPAPPRYDRYRQAVAAGLRAAAVVVAPTRAMLGALARHYGFRPGRAGAPSARVIANGVDPAGFAVAPKEPFILAAGRLWDEAKNVAVLDQVAPELPWPVAVAGDARHPSGGDRAPKAVRLLGWLPPHELRGVMARAGIYALPARYEPFGLSAVEAALSGCPLVLGDIESLREVWGQAAAYVPPDDPAALGRVLRAVCEQPEERARLARAARQRARSYGIAPMVAAYLELYGMCGRLEPSNRDGGRGGRAARPVSSPDHPHL